MPKTTTITWDQFKDDVSLLAHRIRFLDKSFEQIVAITRGGLIPAALLSHHLGIKIIETVCVGSYKDGEQQVHEVIYKGPGPAGTRGKETLIVDDLVDTGNTASLVKETMYPRSILAVVYGKPAGLFAADLYAVEIPQDIWVIFPWEEGIS